MKSTNTKWFTLVELIIVITILAILATIAFISFQGYTKDARNSKRASDLNSIVKSIEVKVAEWVSLTSVVTSDATRVVAGNLAWETIATFSAWEYVWGTVNHTIVWGNADSFKDPLDKVWYSIAATTRAGWVYQLAAVKEVDGTQENYVLWNYTARWTTEVTGTISWIALWTQTFTATNNLGFLKKGDIVTINDTTDWVWEITAISRDLATITVNITTASVGGAVTWLLLNNWAEVSYLVGDGTNPISTTVFAY